MPEEDEEAKRGAGAPDYDVDHYLRTLLVSYASRLRKAFAPEDFERIFRMEEQMGLCDRPVSAVVPLWIRCAE